MAEAVGDDQFRSRRRMFVGLRDGDAVGVSHPLQRLVDGLELPGLRLQGVEEGLALLLGVVEEGVVADAPARVVDDDGTDVADHQIVADGIKVPAFDGGVGMPLSVDLGAHGRHGGRDLLCQAVGILAVCRVGVSY